jgi:3-oxoacyl-[acyl-carrier-protein] synthase III
MRYSKILGTGGYLPEKILTNFDIEKMVDTTNEWIVERSGIHARHVAADNESALTMAAEAGRRALAAANLSPQDIGMIIVSTTTPDRVFPSTACLLQDIYNIPGCPAFDLNSAACAGFVYAFSIADQFIRQGTIKNILIVSTELMSRVLDWSDRSTCVLFGDGAGAVVLGPSDTPGVLSTHLHADGTHKDVLSIKYNFDPLPVSMDKLTMVGSQLFKLAVNYLGDLFDETLAAHDLKKSDIDWLIPHQANIRIIHGMAKKLSMPLDRVAITLGEQGNTSSASIPLALDKTIRDGKLTRGQLMLMEGFGGGLAWGSALVRY